MPIYQLKLIERREVTTGTLVLSFEKPPAFSFTPGQYGGFTLIDPAETDARGITRRFSLLSTPQEETLSIATRMPPNISHSAFKRALAHLPIGSAIKFAGPTGRFTLHDSEDIPAVFIAGGIGIAPFYSMIKHAQATKRKQPLQLFYGNAVETDAAFLAELNALTHPNFQLIAALDQPNPDWQGEVGFINEAMLRKHIKDLAAPIYYLCGSPTMVTALQAVLTEMGIDEARVQTEDFPGY